MKSSEIPWTKLQEPFTPRWRVLSTKTGPAIMVAYVDARQVASRLDEVFTPAGWSNNYDAETGLGTIGILIDNDWVFKSDVGTASNIDPIKGKASDAFKRAAVMWGIGRDLYSTEQRVLKCTDHKYPETELGVKLITGDQQSNYLNGLSENRALIMQIWNRNPSLREDQRFKDALNILREVAK